MAQLKSADAALQSSTPLRESRSSRTGREAIKRLLPAFGRHRVVVTRLTRMTPCEAPANVIGVVEDVHLRETWLPDVLALVWGTLLMGTAASKVLPAVVSIKMSPGAPRWLGWLAVMWPPVNLWLVSVDIVLAPASSVDIAPAHHYLLCP